MERTGDEQRERAPFRVQHGGEFGRIAMAGGSGGRQFGSPAGSGADRDQLPSRPTPSLALVLISGLLAIAANKTYANAAWAWVKALLGISLFEGTLITVGAGARRAAELSAAAAAGHGDAAELAAVLHSEWGTLWLLMAVALINIVLAVWRPRLFRGVAPR